MSELQVLNCFEHDCKDNAVFSVHPENPTSWEDYHNSCAAHLQEFMEHDDGSNAYVVALVVQSRKS